MRCHANHYLKKKNPFISTAENSLIGTIKMLVMVAWVRNEAFAIADRVDERLGGRGRKASFS